MTIDNNTGKNKEFYDLGKKMFDQIKPLNERVVADANGRKYITTEPRLDQGPDYERGFVDGMLHQTQTSVDKAVNRMAQPEQEPMFTYAQVKAHIQAAMMPIRPWVGLTDEDLKPLSDKWRIVYGGWVEDFAKEIEAKLKEKNSG